MSRLMQPQKNILEVHSSSFKLESQFITNDPDGKYK
jgi:hypothetical protein